jgi:hypothetical protein
MFQPTNGVNSLASWELYTIYNVVRQQKLKDK